MRSTTTPFTFTVNSHVLPRDAGSRARLAGVEQILIFNGPGVAAHEASTGRELWTHSWPATHPHVALPLVCPGDRVLISSGYGTGGALVQIRKVDDVFTTETLWKSLSMKAKFANPVRRDDSIFGLDDGILACIDMATGKRRWKRGRYGHGQLLLVGDILLITAETGELVLVAADAEKHRELARLEVFDAKTWNPPALAGRYLLMRTDAVAACYRLPVAK